MEDNDMFAVIWRCVAAVIIGITLASAGCTANTHYQITQALMHGVDPLAVACAHGNDGSATDCAVLASKR